MAALEKLDDGRLEARVDWAVVVSEAGEWPGDTQHCGDHAILQWQSRLPPHKQDLAYQDPTVVKHRVWLWTLSSLAGISPSIASI